MPESLIIRPMKPAETGAVARLFHNVWHETQARLQDPRQARARDLGFFRQRVESRATTTLVAVKENNLAGFVTWTGGMLNSLFVESQFRRLSIGEALCHRAEVEMARTGAKKFELDCIYGNTSGRRFYEHLGWRADRIEILKNETSEGICETRAWRMMKP